MRSRWLSLLLGAIVAAGVYLLVAPLSCQRVLEVVGAGENTTITQGEAGPVRCTRVLLPDYTAAAEPARWPAVLAAAALGTMAALAIQGRRPADRPSAPPPGEAG